MKKITSLLTATAMIAGCASSVNVAVDPASINDRAKFQDDYKVCQEIAKTYDLSQDTGANAVMGAAAGAIGIAGVATAIAGAIFAPAIPFIIAGGAAGGGLAGGMTKKKESEARENILAGCLSDRGYRAFDGATIR